MKTLELYLKPVGTRVNLKLKPNDQVGPYVVFVQKWVAGNKVAVGTWFPAQLESPAGIGTVLDHAEGYDFIIKANITSPPDTATLVPELRFDNAVVYKTPIYLPAAEGPVVSREWSVIIDEGGA
jgi:hypothetical protein